MTAAQLNHTESGISSLDNATDARNLFNIVYTDTLSWDGSTNNRSYFTQRNSVPGLGMLDLVYVKISDYVPDIEIFKTNSYSFINKDQQESKTQSYAAGEGLREDYENHYYVGHPNIVVVYSPCEFYDSIKKENVTMETGIYCSKQIFTSTDGSIMEETYITDFKVSNHNFPMPIIRQDLISADHFILTDTVTGLKYKLQVTNGTLAVAEVV